MTKKMDATEKADKNMERILLAHGGGGELTKSLIEKHILPRLGNPILNELGDSAVFGSFKGKICMTTDSFVVQPIEFPGGDIGRLAICGTINDLAVMGAIPKVITLALILEEGLELNIFDRIIDSIKMSSDEAGVTVVTGDTKVIERQRGDGLMITTTGVGSLPHRSIVGMGKIDHGDVIIINGGIAEHGLAVMCMREGLGFETQLKSDVAPLNGLIQSILDAEVSIRFMRDPTRSGVAGVFADIAESTGLTVEINERDIPLSPIAKHTSEILGIDPLTVANEGKVVIVANASDADRIVRICHKHKYGKSAAIIGRVIDKKPALVELITKAGGRRIIQRPYGEELPRIC
jgi:hydrogenase expression/formation protein HypE